MTIRWPEVGFLVGVMDGIGDGIGPENLCVREDNVYELGR